ncbi:MAG: hypothetical protein AAGU32_05850, partial [Bacillota bacterium]
KNANGDIVGYGSGSTGSDSFNIWAESALTDDACYFTFNSRTTNGNLVDTSLIPGGYGIYCLPYSAGEPEDGGTQMGELSMVYPLDPTVRQVKLYTNPEQTKLLLLTLEDGKCVLTVIGIDTMQPLQRLELAEPGEDGGIWDVFNYGAFMALSLSDNRLVVVSLTDEDEYVLSISTELTDPENPLYYLRYDSVMAWYGGRLAVSNALMNDMDRNKTCGFYLAVYDKSGLLYYGEYASSLDAGAPDDYMYRCLPEDIAPLALRWGT